MYTLLQTRQGHNRRHPFSDILKNFASKWSRTAAGKSKTSTMLALFIDDKNVAKLFAFHWQFSFPSVVLVFKTFQFVPDQFTRS